MPSDEANIPPCPNCGSDRVIPIVYGLPSARALEGARRGEYQLGGCSISLDSPRWACDACGYAFGDHQDAFRRLFPGVARPGSLR